MFFRGASAGGKSGETRPPANAGFQQRVPVIRQLSISVIAIAQAYGLRYRIVDVRRVRNVSQENSRLFMAAILLAPQSTQRTSMQ